MRIDVDLQANSFALRFVFFMDLSFGNLGDFFSDFLFHQIIARKQLIAGKP